VRVKTKPALPDGYATGNETKPTKGASCFLS